MKQNNNKKQIKRKKEKDEELALGGIKISFIKLDAQNMLDNGLPINTLHALFTERVRKQKGA
jgi:hypothetical protein